MWTDEVRLGGYCKRSWLGIDKEKGVSRKKKDEKS